jgi:hypothetical protein
LNVKRVLDSLNLDQVHAELAEHYHPEGPGRTPINPLAMLKAQLAKHLLQIPSDRRLALRLRKDRRLARARAHDPGVDTRLPEPDLYAGGGGDCREVWYASSGQVHQAVR